MYDAHTILRIVVFAAFCLAALVALAGWLVRTRRVSPFGGVGRTLRSVTDPVLRPVETRLVRLGGNPVHAGWWLVVLVAVAGVLLDRKSIRLNSSHRCISYAVFCLKKKTRNKTQANTPLRTQICPRSSS